MVAKRNDVVCGSVLDPSDIRTNRIALWPQLITFEYIWQSSKYAVTDGHGTSRGKKGMRTRAGVKTKRGYNRHDRRACKPWGNGHRRNPTS